MDCLFCKIASGEIPSNTIYEDQLIKIFLDINPVSNGHCLIIPKRHYDDFRDIPASIINHMYNTIKMLYPKYQDTLKCKGLTICHNTEYGQEIKHFHIHFIPRYPNDDIKMISNKDLLNDLSENLKKIKA